MSTFVKFDNSIIQIGFHIKNVEQKRIISNIALQHIIYLLISGYVGHFSM